MSTPMAGSHPPFVPIILVVGVDRNYAIGKDSALPWHVPADMKLFRHITLHNPVIMGRVTWESLRQPLVHRTNIILSSSLQHKTFPSSDKAHVYTASSPEKAHLAAKKAILSHHQKNPNPAIMIIGGASIYKLFLPLADEIYISHLNLSVEDPHAFFPQSHLKGWHHLEKDQFSHQPSSPSSSENVAFNVQRYLSPKIADQPEKYPRLSSNLLSSFSLDLPPSHRLYSSKETTPLSPKDNLSS